MAKIHGLVYIAVGLFVSILSYKLNYQKLIFFFYAGLIFIFVGVVKFVFNLIKRRMTKTEEKHYKIKHQAHHFRHCSKCGNIIKANDRFCSRCGARV